jgi:hypothetical protein
MITHLAQTDQRVVGNGATMKNFALAYKLKNAANA